MWVKENRKRKKYKTKLTIRRNIKSLKTNLIVLKNISIMKIITAIEIINPIMPCMITPLLKEINYYSLFSIDIIMHINRNCAIGFYYIITST
jgi:hypothetical protein